MQFTDVTLEAGRVRSRRRYDSRDLAPGAVEVAAGMLRALRLGAQEVPHGIPGMVEFTVRRGLAAPWPQVASNRLLFTVGAPGLPPFQFNALLRADTPEAEGCEALTTVLAISLAGGIMTPTELEETARPLWEERPLLATALLPQPGATPERVHIAADFATCFAAAWLAAWLQEKRR